MSYTRQYHEVVHGTKTVYYSASKSGGSTTVSIDIPVTVNIHVDTIPFDSSVRGAERNIDLLTASVVATETAAIAAKQENARKVGDTIVNGFFSYVKSEISQQIAEITQQTEAHLIHIRGLSESCLAKKEQMMTDYNRITGRYTKLFMDLNKELSSRIHELDKHAFLFKELTSDLETRTQGSSGISTLIIFNSENTDIQVKINSALAKRQAAGAMQKITAFLAQQKQAEAAIGHSMQEDNQTKSLYLPVCFAEMKTSAMVTDKKCYSPDVLPNEQQKAISNYPMSASWIPLNGENLIQLNFFFHKELNQRLPGGEEQSLRIRKMIQQLATLDQIQVIK